MKKKLTIISLLNVLFFSFGQNIEILNDKSYSLLNSFPNQLRVVSKDCEQYRYETNNGKIEAQKNCEIIITPQKEGTLTIFVFSKNDEKIYEKHFRVSNIKPKLYFLGFPFNQKKFTKEELLNIRNILTICEELTCSDYDNSSLAFEIIILRKNKTYKKIENFGSNLSLEAKEEFKNVGSGDIIVFNNPTIILSGQKFFLDELVIEIK